MRSKEKNQIIEGIIAASCERFYQEAIDLVKTNVCPNCQALAEECRNTPCRIAESLFIRYSQDLASKNFMWN